jgi:hypothetical protein
MLASLQQGGNAAASQDGALTEAITRALEAHAAKVTTARLLKAGLTRKQAGRGLQAYPTNAPQGRCSTTFYC